MHNRIIRRKDRHHPNVVYKCKDISYIYGDHELEINNKYMSRMNEHYYEYMINHS